MIQPGGERSIHLELAFGNALFPAVDPGLEPLRHPRATIEPFFYVGLGARHGGVRDAPFVRSST